MYEGLVGMDMERNRWRIIAILSSAVLVTVVILLAISFAPKDGSDASADITTLPAATDTSSVGSPALGDSTEGTAEHGSVPSTSSTAGESSSSTLVSPSNPDFQPSPPITAAFLYPWFPEAWTQRGITPYTNFTPSLGLYASSDTEVVGHQVELASAAGIDAFIASWWGPGHHTDIALREIFANSVGPGTENPGFRWAIYFEEEGQSDPSVDSLVADLRYLAESFFDNPAYLRVDGRPVVFVWSTGDEPDMTTRWLQAKDQLGGDLYVVLKVFSGYRDAPNQPDSWHQYGPASSYTEHLPHSVTVSPGFQKVGEAPRLERDLDRFRSDVARMSASQATWHLITSWNEWGEGTSIEPANEWGTTYLDVLSGSPSTASTTVSATQPGPRAAVTFAAGGDIGATEATTATLQLIRSARPDFFLALGDLSYSDLEPESAWCDYITAQLGSEMPVELVVGNHEDDDRPDGWIGAFAACLPDRMGMTGVYPAQYFFDVDGLARIVVVGAGNTVDGVDYDYEVGSAAYAWLQSTIDGARARSIPWVVVAMHKNCVTVGQKGCEIGQDLVDLLIEKRVDLVLQGHDHTYQRSHQLRCAIAGSFDAPCVADYGGDGKYHKGSGTVFVISGATGGGSLYATDENDPEAGYMTTWMGGDDALAGRGYVLVSISNDELTGQFIGATTAYADRFSIGP